MIDFKCSRIWSSYFFRFRQTDKMDFSDEGAEGGAQCPLSRIFGLEPPLDISQAYSRWKRINPFLCLRGKIGSYVFIFVSAYRYIAITNLPIIPVFVEYLRQFLIDFNQIYRHSSVPANTSPCIFWAFLSQAVSEHGAAATFFTVCLSRCRESLDCLTLAYFGLINVFPVTVDDQRRKIEIFLSWA